MNREDIVKNGCIGKCCEHFNLPFNPQELDKMIAAIDAGNKYYTKDNGNSFHTKNEPQAKQIRDMLIYLGHNVISELDRPGFVALGEVIRYLLFIPEDEPILASDLKKVSGINREWLELVDGEVYVNQYTCNKYDTEQRICTDYENRPNMCRVFATNHPCPYEGCRYYGETKRTVDALTEESYKLLVEEHGK